MCITKKGKGYPPAEDNPSLFHGVGPFDLATGKVLKGKGGAASYTGIFGETLRKIAAEDEQVVAITAAMPDGTGLTPFAQGIPGALLRRGHCRAARRDLCRGARGRRVAAGGCAYTPPSCSAAYDQVFHDVCLQNLPVVFAIDRAGVVGSDGPTHHGVFDLSYLRHLPNMTVMAPKDENELQHMIHTAILHDGPAAVRYPRGNGVGVPLDQTLKASAGRARANCSGKGGRGRSIAIGTMVHPALEAAQILAAEGIELCRDERALRQAARPRADPCPCRRHRHAIHG